MRGGGEAVGLGRPAWFMPSSTARAGIQQQEGRERILAPKGWHLARAVLCEPDSNRAGAGQSDNNTYGAI